MATDHYVITIPGETYTNAGYTTVATLLDAASCTGVKITANEGSGTEAGKLIITVYNTASPPVKVTTCGFGFSTFKVA
ncbi:MAG: hypothetical protein NVSMB57_02400 [Actinomycetota bacterium]